MIDYNTFLRGLEEYRRKSTTPAHICNQDSDKPSNNAIEFARFPPQHQGSNTHGKECQSTDGNTELTTRQLAKDINQPLNASHGKVADAGCVFCISNKERPAVYKSHCIKDDKGRVTCPILRAYVCPLCAATGDNAHTIRYCQRTAVGVRTSGFLRTPRNSAGKLIRQQKQ